MATPLAPLVNKKLHAFGNLGRLVVEIPSVLPASSSPRYELQIDSDAGILQQVRVAFAGDTTISIFVGTVDGAYRGTIEEILRVTDIQFCWQRGNLGIIYENTDAFDPAFHSRGLDLLYVEVDNTGSTNPTNVISLELVVEAPGRRRVD